MIYYSEFMDVIRATLKSGHRCNRKGCPVTTHRVAAFTQGNVTFCYYLCESCHRRYNLRIVVDETHNTQFLEKT